MSKGRHKKKKPLFRRATMGAFVLVPAMGAAIVFANPGEEVSKPEVIAATSVTPEVRLPALPQALDASMGETTQDLCSPFEALDQNCVVTYAYSSDARGTLLSQVPAAGTESEEVALRYSKGPKRVAVPILAGLTLDEARMLSWRAGLQVSTVKYEDAAVAKSTVVRTSLDPSSKVPNGNSVVLYSSTGKVKVPAWVDKTQELVEAEATELGLTVVFEEVESSKPAGVVVKQDRAGKRVDFSKPLTVTISKAPEGSNEDLPDVIGLTQTEAISILASKGFIKITTVRAGASAGSDEVLTMKPEAGSEVDTSVEIQLTVG